MRVVTMAPALSAIEEEAGGLSLQGFPMTSCFVDELPLEITIPVVVAVCIAFDIPIVLGLEPRDIVLLALAILVAIMGVGGGRTNLMQGAVQVVIFAAFLFLSLVP